MARTWTSFVLLICALAVGSSFGTTPTPTPTSTIPPRPPSTSHMPAPTVVPIPNTNTYTLRDDDGEVCLMLVASMTVTYTYKNASNTSETLTIVDPVHNPSTDDSPNCTTEAAMLILRWEPAVRYEEATPRYLRLNFSANLNKGSRHWTFDGVDLTVVFSKTDFPDYNSHNTTGNLIYNKTPGFFDETVEFERGYQCNAAMEYPLKNPTKHQITASITVRDFHVQAFEFKEAGEFGNARRCQADSGDGKKIVPIAVGVALAVLIIAVIIAFIISKLVNRRRQTSYETLN